MALKNKNYTIKQTYRYLDNGKETITKNPYITHLTQRFFEMKLFCHFVC